MFLCSSQLARIRVHGFSAREVATVRRLYLADLERAYIERDQALSDSLRAEYVQVSWRPLEPGSLAAPARSISRRNGCSRKNPAMSALFFQEKLLPFCHSHPATLVLLRPVETKAPAKAGEARLGSSGNLHVCRQVRHLSVSVLGMVSTYKSRVLVRAPC